MKNLVLILFINSIIFSQAKNNLLPDTTLVPGKSYFGTENYIEYIHGNLPLVFSAPHGGYDKPEEMSDRTRSALNQDIRTLELTLELSKQLYELTGKYPYLVLNKLHRIKLDPNRELEVAIQTNDDALIPYNEFHEFIDLAEEDVFKQWGTGFYIDIHAHPYKDRKLELGYLLEAELLFFSDTDIEDDLYIEKSSIKNLVRKSPYSFSQLIRGNVSFGSMLEKRGWEVVPSPSKPEPDDENFFSGGYNTAVHGATEKYNFNGLQIETHWDGLRDTDENMQRFCHDLAKVIIEYLKLHYDIDLTKL